VRRHLARLYARVQVRAVGRQARQRVGLSIAALCIRDGYIVTITMGMSRPDRRLAQQHERVGVLVATLAM